MATLRVKLGKAVRRLRTSAGYSQESFADACSLHRTYIGSVERGEINISLDNLDRIARTLKVPVSTLFIDAEQGR
jgi:transcriptional regulator with XRE-family HTH domain